MQSKENKTYEVCKYNALTHGMLRETLTEYEKFDLEAFYGNLREEFCPQNTFEEMLLERIAVAYIKLKRVGIAEAEFMKEVLDPSHSKFDNLHFDGDYVGYKPKMSSEKMQKLALLYSRYETSAENRFYRALSQFTALRKEKI